MTEMHLLFCQVAGQNPVEGFSPDHFVPLIHRSKENINFLKRSTLSTEQINLKRHKKAT